MDAGSFDRWTRGISTAAAARRSLLGGALAVLLAPVLAGDASAGKGGKGGKGNDKKKKDKKKDKKPDCRNGTTRCGDESSTRVAIVSIAAAAAMTAPRLRSALTASASPVRSSRLVAAISVSTRPPMRRTAADAVARARPARPVSTASASAVGRAVRFQAEAPIAAPIQAARVAPMAGAVGRTRSVRQMNDAARRTTARGGDGSCCPTAPTAVETAVPAAGDLPGGGLCT